MIESIKNFELYIKTWHFIFENSKLLIEKIKIKIKMEKNGKIHSFSGILRTIVVSSDFSKSLMATRIASLRLG